MGSASPMFVLRALWRGNRGGQHYSGPEAQALEYAATMGEAALLRQWCGNDRSLRKISKRLVRAV